jgi:hypothetical protein
MGFQIVRLGLEDLLGGQYGIADPAGAQIQFSQPAVQILRARVGVQRQFVFLDGTGGVLGAAIVSSYMCARPKW